MIMHPNILDCKKIANDIYAQLQHEISLLDNKPVIRAVLVGENPASLVYIRQKEKWAEYVGIDFGVIKFDQSIDEETLINEIIQLNQNTLVHGYIVQLPLPEHFNVQKIIHAIDPCKDIDGFHATNVGKALIGDPSGFVPCTPGGIMNIFQYSHIALIGKIITVIGRSNIVGKPMTALLLNAGATVINCNSKTPNIKDFTQKSDIVIIATGKSKMLKADMIGKNTIVIDVGISKTSDGALSGDADFENIVMQGNTITPVPGGVGAMTVAMLLKNALKACKTTSPQPSP